MIKQAFNVKVLFFFFFDWMAWIQRGAYPRLWLLRVYIEYIGSFVIASRFIPGSGIYTSRFVPPSLHGSTSLLAISRSYFSISSLRFSSVPSLRSPRRLHKFRLFRGSFFRTIYLNPRHIIMIRWTINCNAIY